MPAMIFISPPPCGQCSMSISNTHFNKRAQLIRTETGGYCASSFASDGLLLFCFPEGIISARNLALGASTPLNADFLCEPNFRYQSSYQFVPPSRLALPCEMHNAGLSVESRCASASPWALVERAPACWPNHLASYGYFALCVTPYCRQFLVETDKLVGDIPGRQRYCCHRGWQRAAHNLP